MEKTKKEIRCDYYDAKYNCCMGQKNAPPCDYAYYGKCDEGYGSPHCVEYAVVKNGKFLQDIEPNENYSKTGVAPVMGTRHSYTEFNTVWGSRPKWFEPKTLVNTMLRVLTDEFNWGELIPTWFEIRTRIR